MVDEALLARVIGAMRRLRDDPYTLERYYGGNVPAIPASLMHIHNEFTMPHEGGYQNHDNANGTLAGITNSSFRTHMRRLGVELTPTQAREILAHLGSTLMTARDGTTIQSPNASESMQEAWELFQNLAAHAHFQAYDQAPGFNRLPEELRVAVYDPAFHRGNGPGLVMMARMLERHTNLDFPGINTEDRRENFDADPLVIQRIFLRLRNSRGEINPHQLARELERHGISLNDGPVRLATSYEPHNTVPLRNSWIDADSVRIETPYDDRWVNEPANSTNRRNWDALVNRVREGTQTLIDRGWTEERFVAEIERERREHQDQLIRAQGGESSYRNGWDNRSRTAAEQIANLANEGRAIALAAVNDRARAAANPVIQRVSYVADSDNVASEYVHGSPFRVQYRRTVNGIEAVAIDTPNGVFMYEIGEDGGFIQQVPGTTMPRGVELLTLFPSPGHERNPSETHFTLTWVGPTGYRHYLTLTEEVGDQIRRSGTVPLFWGMGERSNAWFNMDGVHLSEDSSDSLRLDDRDLSQIRWAVRDTETNRDSITRLTLNTNARER